MFEILAIPILLGIIYVLLNILTTPRSDPQAESEELKRFREAKRRSRKRKRKKPIW